MEKGFVRVIRNFGVKIRKNLPNQRDMGDYFCFFSEVAGSTPPQPFFEAPSRLFVVVFLHYVQHLEGGLDGGFGLVGIQPSGT